MKRKWQKYQKPSSRVLEVGLNFEGFHGAGEKRRHG